MTNFDSSINNLLIDRVSKNFICKNNMTKEMKLEIQKGDCRRLVLGIGDWGDLDFLSDLSKPIESLVIKSDNIDWNSLVKLTQLKELFIDNPIKEKVDFSLFKSLIALNYHWDKKNIDSVLSLPNIEHLIIWGGKEDNFSGFKKLSSLKYLEVIGGRFNSVEHLAELKNLKALFLARLTKMEDISELSDLIGLQCLSIQSCNKIKFPSSLSKLKELKKLSLIKQKNFESINFIKSYEKIEILHVFEMAVDDGDLSFIKSIPSLKRIKIEPKKHYNLDTKKLNMETISKYGEYDKSVSELIGIKEYFN